MRRAARVWSCPALPPPLSPVSPALVEHPLEQGLLEVSPQEQQCQERRCLVTEGREEQARSRAGLCSIPHRQEQR